MRSPRMSSWAPTGVAICFFRARCPSKASSAMAATVNPTAARLAHAPRPNRHTARNPTTTRRNVTLLAVHRILICRLPPEQTLTGGAWQPQCQSCAPTSYVCSDTYKLIRHSCPGSTPAKSFICRPLAPSNLVSFSAFCASKTEGLAPLKTHGRCPAAERRGSPKDLQDERERDLWENKR